VTGVRRLLGVAVIALLMVGCGGGDDGGDDGEAATTTFDDDRFGITFEYPEDFRLGDVTEVDRSAGGESTADQGIGIDDDNAIFISRYELAAQVTEDNLDDVQVELDGVVRDLVDAEVTGERTTVGGLFAFQYVDVPVEPPADGESDLTFVFDGDIQYQINCQSTPNHRSRMDDACQQALATLAPA
jgi:hypothetical protein